MNYKDKFPILNNSKKLIYLDSASTSQKPKSVIKVMKDFYERENANIHRGVYKLSQKATEKYDKAREEIAKFINAETNEIIFTYGTTDGINKLSRVLPLLFKNKDEIVLSQMEHHSNLVPWQEAARKNNMKLKFIPINKDYKLDYVHAEKIINKKTAIVSITHISNALGILNDIEKIISIAKKHGAIVIIDAAQSIPHIKLNVKKLNCDFLVFSGHKVYGPLGIGVLYGKKQLLDKITPFNFGGDMISKVSLEKTEFAEIPRKFEGGTQNISGVVGLAEAIKFIQKIGINKIERYEKKLVKYTLNKLREMKDINIYSNENNSSIISFNFNGVHSHDVASILDDYNICVRAGHHCCMPLMNKLGVAGTVRISLGIYNTKEDIDKLIQGLNKVSEIFRK